MIILSKTEKERVEKALKAFKKGEAAHTTTIEKISVIARACIKYSYSSVKNYDNNVITRIAIAALKDAIDYYDGDLEKFISLADYFITQKLESHLNKYPSQLIPRYSTVMTNILKRFPQIPQDKIGYIREVISYIGESYMEKTTRNIIKLYYSETTQSKETIAKISKELNIPKNKIKAIIDKFDDTVNMRIIPLIGEPVKEEKERLGLISYAVSIKYSQKFVNESLCYLPENKRKKFVNRFGIDLDTPKPNISDKELDSCYKEFIEFLQTQIKPIVKPQKPYVDPQTGIFAYTRKEGYSDKDVLKFIKKCSPELQAKLSMSFGKNYDRINGYTALERSNVANELLLYLALGMPDTPVQTKTSKISK